MVAADLSGAEVGDQLPLTEREREVMTLVASGLQSVDMGEHLSLSPDTVRSHVQNAMAKLGAHTRAHAVAIALVSGQITWENDGGSSTLALPSSDQSP